MKFTEGEIQLLDRHYTKIKIFGRVILLWNTSPRAVLRHLQELKVKNLSSNAVLKVTSDSTDNKKESEVAVCRCFEPVKKIDAEGMLRCGWCEKIMGRQTDF